MGTKCVLYGIYKSKINYNNSIKDRRDKYKCPVGGFLHYMRSRTLKLISVYVSVSQALIQMTVGVKLRIHIMIFNVSAKNTLQKLKMVHQKYSVSAKG